MESRSRWKPRSKSISACCKEIYPWGKTGWTGDGPPRFAFGPLRRQTMLCVYALCDCFSSSPLPGLCSPKRPTLCRHSSRQTSRTSGRPTMPASPATARKPFTRCTSVRRRWACATLWNCVSGRRNRWPPPSIRNIPSSMRLSGRTRWRCRSSVQRS